MEKGKGVGIEMVGNIVNEEGLGNGRSKVDEERELHTGVRAQ